MSRAQRAGFGGSTELQCGARFWPAAATAYGQMYEACAGQPACAAAYPDLERVFTDTVARLDAQPLVVAVGAASGGTFDAITDPSWQEVVTPGLSASQAVHFPGLGHQVFLQSACAVSVMQAFVAAPDQPVDQACVAEMSPPAFTVP